MASRIRQNYVQENEALVNKHINMEFRAFYTYTSMGYFFDRDDVSLQGFRDFFLKMADRKYTNAKKLMSFQNERGGHILLLDIGKPEKDEWGSGKEVIETALEMEKQLSSSLQEMYKTACSTDDAQMADFVTGHFIAKQTGVIKELGDHATLLEELGTEHGEWHYQQTELS
jgi:ferritin heavy chain